MIYKHDIVNIRPRFNEEKKHMNEDVSDKRLGYKLIPKIDHVAIYRSIYDVWNESLAYKFTFIPFMIFVISLPFNNTIEMSIIPIARFELKATMVSFLLLFASCLLYTLKYPKRISPVVSTDYLI
jgi:hypothetical protein